MTDHIDLSVPRSPRLEEREALLDMLNYIFRTLASRESTIAVDWPHIYSPANLENVVIITDGTKIVGSTGIWINDIEIGDACLRVGGINCVGILPDYRRHGLGGQMMEAARQRMCDAGCHVGLLGTQIANWYRRLGWERAGCARSYRFDRANIGLLPSLHHDIRLRFGANNDIAALLRLHHADRLGGVRDADTLGVIMASRKNPSLCLAEKANGEAAAYLLARDAAVLEWGGAADTVAGLVRVYFETVDDQAISTSLRDASFRPVLLQYMTVASPSSGHSFVNMLDGLRIPYSTDYMGMMYLINPRGVLDAFGHSEIAAKESHDVFTISRGRESATLDRGLLTKLFFGPERVCNVASDVFPLPLWQWGLEHV